MIDGAFWHGVGIGSAVGVAFWVGMAIVYGGAVLYRYLVKIARGDA